MLKLVVFGLGVKLYIASEMRLFVFHFIFSIHFSPTQFLPVCLMCVVSVGGSVVPCEIIVVKCVTSVYIENKSSVGSEMCNLFVKNEFFS